MLKFPRKEDGKKEQNLKEWESKGKKGREDGERKKERTVKGQNGMVYWERGRKCVKRNECVWSVTRKQNIFFWALMCIKPVLHCSAHSCLKNCPMMFGEFCLETLNKLLEEGLHSYGQTLSPNTVVMI